MCVCVREVLNVCAHNGKECVCILEWNQRAGTVRLSEYLSAFQSEVLQCWNY